MRVALISFECPPSLKVGGMGTYTAEAARMLSARGVSVEVFAAGSYSEATYPGPNFRLNRVAVQDRNSFPELVAPVVAERHAEAAFDVIESPDFGPEGGVVSELLPGVPRVTKLHTPTILIAEAGYAPPPPRAQLRFFLGSLRKGKFRTLRNPNYQKEEDPEYRHAISADEIAAPSAAIAEKLRALWGLPEDRISTFPYPYSPGEEYLVQTAPKRVKTIGYLGRLETRKGVTDLALAIPKIWRRAPDLRFRLIGPDWPLPFGQGGMTDWIRRQLGDARDAVEMTGAISHLEIAAQLKQCDLIVLPSRWENFPYACAEAMAAARVVVASEAGGMAEMITHDVNGLLIPPREPALMAEAILRLAADPSHAERLANSARASICQMLHPDQVFPLQMNSYHRAIAEHHRRRSGRPEGRERSPIS